MQYLICAVLLTGCIVDPKSTADPDVDATLIDAALADLSVPDRRDAAPVLSRDAAVADAELSDFAPEPDPPEPDPPEPDPPEPDPPVCDADWVVVAEVDVPGAARDLEFRDNRVYGVLYPQGLAIVNLTNPRAPRLQAVFDVQGAHALALSPTEPWGVVAALGDGVRVIDFTNPDVLRETGAFDLVGAAGAEYAQDIELDGTTAYVAAGSQGFWRVDVADPARPRGTGSCCGQGGHPLAGPRGLTLHSGGAYVADSELGLIAVSLDADGPHAQGTSIALPGAAQAVEIFGALAYVLVDDDRVITVNNRRLGTFEIEAEIAVPPPATSLRAGDDAVLVATGDGVWRLQDDDAGQVLDLEGRAATSVLVDGDWMYVGVDGGLVVAERICR